MRIMALAAAFLLVSCGGNSKPDIKVDSAWARASLPRQMSSAAYFTISNAGGPDRLVSVASPGGQASLHSTSMANGVMKMRPLQSLEIPANGSVALDPGGTHVMLMGLKQPLVAGSTIELDLKFEKSGERHVQAAVRSAAGAAM